MFNSNYAFSLSYPTQASGGTGGYQNRRANVYALQDDPAYEMDDVKDSRTELAPNVNENSMTSFYSEAGLVCPAYQTDTKVFYPDFFNPRELAHL